MPHGKSQKTQVVGIRLPKETVDKIKRRVNKTRYQSMSDYLRARIIYDVSRKHGKGKKK